MGMGKYYLRIRGNVYSIHWDLKQQFVQEVMGVCRGSYNIQNMEEKYIMHDPFGVGAHRKPIVAGIFTCN